jgi:hypothetical protein
MFEFARSSLVSLVLVCVCFPVSSMAQVDCTTQPGNVILNCGLTSTIQWWTLTTGDSLSWTGTDGDSALGAGAVDAVNVAGVYTAAMSSSACVSGPSPFFSAGASYRIVNGGSGATACTFSVLWYLNNCGTVNDLDTGPAFAVGSSWIRAHSDFGSVGGENPVITLTCTDSVDFTVVFDDAFVASSWVPVQLQQLTID